MAAGSLAGGVKHCAMFPVDTLKIRLQAGSRQTNPRSATTPLSALRTPLLSTVVLGAGPAHAVCFYVYEMSKKLLSINQNQSI